MIAERPLSPLITTPTQALQQFTLIQILGLWAAIALPGAALAWVGMPALAPWLSIPPALLYWLLMVVSLLWQVALAVCLIRQEEGALNWGGMARRARWRLPEVSTSGTGARRAGWRWLPVAVIAALVVALGALKSPINTTLFFLFHLPFPSLLASPPHMNVIELASPEYAGQWWLVALALVTWLLSTLLGEELLFRGLLLPRMTGVFGRGAWMANAALFGLYYLHKPFMIPFRFVEGLLLSGAAQHRRNNRLGLGVRSLEGAGLLVIVLLGVASRPLTSWPLTTALPYVSGRPMPLAMYQGRLTALPACEQPQGTPFQVDLRGADLSTLDLREAAASLACADFDSGTVWPPTEHLPAGFDPARMLALGQNPGLGLRGLHAQGITGRGVGIAIIDQPLLVTHQEYADRLRWYEELSPGPNGTASMHGPAVASIAAGRTVGVAPEADLYYIGAVGGYTSLFLYGHDFAQGIRRILQINEQVPAEHRVRVISISSGWRPEVAGYDAAVAAAREAEAQGVLVLTVGTITPDGWALLGLGREPMGDPDDFGVYGPGLFWADAYYGESRPGRYLLAPMDARTAASPTGDGDYAFYRSGGMSWVVPYFAGVYALAAQVDPAITPERFWALAQATGRSIEVTDEGQTQVLSTVIDPVALVEALR